MGSLYGSRNVKHYEYLADADPMIAEEGHVVMELPAEHGMNTIFFAVSSVGSRIVPRYLRLTTRYTLSMFYN